MEKYLEAAKSLSVFCQKNSECAFCPFKSITQGCVLKNRVPELWMEWLADIPLTRITFVKEGFDND